MDVKAAITFVLANVSRLKCRTLINYNRSVLNIILAKCLKLIFYILNVL